MVTCVPIHSVIDLVGMEYFVDRVSGRHYILDKSSSVFQRQLKHFRHMVLARHDHAARMGLLFEEINGAGGKFAHFITKFRDQFALSAIRTIHIHTDYLPFLMYSLRVIDFVTVILYLYRVILITGFGQNSTFFHLISSLFFAPNGKPFIITVNNATIVRRVFL